jgi:prepilin-type N-terminal cleavage/methylation domain-containing protein
MKIIRAIFATKKGITLIELMVALALISIIATGLISLYWTTASAYNREYLQTEAQYDARVGMDKICKDIRECIDLTGGLEVRDAAGNAVAEGTILYLETNEAVNGIDTDCKIIYVVDNNGILHRQRYIFLTNEFKDSPPLTVNKVEMLFTKLGNGMVKIKMKVKDDEGKTLFELNNQCKRRVD